MSSPLPPFDLDLLRTFVAIVDHGGFTSAAKRVGLTQSALSLQIKKLERNLEKQVFGRGRGQELVLTPHGEILLPYARQILRVSDEARSRLLEGSSVGTVRLGVPEDFATAHLPNVLANFVRDHPRIALEVNCDFTVHLLDGFSKGRYDLVLFKREPQGGSGGIGVWREVLVWAASPALALDAGSPLPLVLAPAPDLYRKRALICLETIGRPWRMAYASPSLAGLQAAVKAGLGVTVLPREMVPAGIDILGPEYGLPPLPDTEIVLRKAPGSLTRPAELLAEHIVTSLEKAADLVAAAPRAEEAWTRGQGPQG